MLSPGPGGGRCCHLVPWGEGGVVTWSHGGGGGVVTLVPRGGGGRCCHLVPGQGWGDGGEGGRAVLSPGRGGEGGREVLSPGPGGGGRCCPDTFGAAHLPPPPPPVEQNK